MSPFTSPLAADWAGQGSLRELLGHRVFTVEVPAIASEDAEPLLIIHGFPTSSFDFHLVLEALAQHRRVLLLDLLGFGLSDKPDMRYSITQHADIVQAYTAELGVDSLALLTHDMGDTVGGELLARQAEGTWPVQVTRRVLSNGSIYIEMAQLTAGQQMLLAMPDEWLPADFALDASSMGASLAATFSAHAQVAKEELEGAWDMIAHHDGQHSLARTIRYIEDRRRDQPRYTGAIETHPSPLSIVWGVDDPVAVVAMTERLRSARPDAPLTLLDHVGHYPMIEAPVRFADAVTTGLA